MAKRGGKWKLGAALLAVALVAGMAAGFAVSVAVPDQPVVMYGGDGGAQTIKSAGTCGTIGTAQLPAFSETGVDPTGFSILSWNVQKGENDGWLQDLGKLAGRVDFIMLQEAVLDHGLKEKMRQLRHDWLLGVAFQLGQNDTGVFSAGSVSPRRYCSLRETEPLIFIPKIALVSSYPIKSSKETLLVVNIHMVNFTLGASSVRRQVESVRALVNDHRGPVIVAGDLNTWSDKRLKAVDSLLREDGMRPVSFSPDNRVTFFNHTVDGVYYRDLEVTGASSYRVDSSDHNPVEVHFRMNTEAGA